MFSQIVNHNISTILTLFQKERLKLESSFQGLPDSVSSLLKSLLTLADPLTGIVSNISYSELSNLLTTHPNPGRKISGKPTKQTIRNYIKSIEKKYGCHFKIISEGQSLKFLFPELSAIYKRIYQNTVSNSDDDIAELIEKTNEKAIFKEEVNTQLNTEVNTPDVHVKNNINNKNNNKQTNTTEGVSSAKKCIADDFYPDEQTIDLAKTLGFTNAEEPEEIKAFIYHNKINQTQWADFNPIYIRWLERKAEYQLKQQNRTQGLLRSTNNERRFYQKPGQQSELHAVSVTHGISCESIWESGEHSESESFIDSGRLIQIVDEAHSNIWSDFR